ncbi:MAG: dTMP kinase [Gammaproteobacteria bacterium]|nr:dTMP kinase [Gammaproteobacteria bacterium]
MDATRRGRFITLEGPDGAGKTTQAHLVAAILRAHGKEVVTTREPGGTAVGNRLRQVLLDPETPVQPTTETLLMFAARAEHVARVIEPALAAGRWVVCDRFTDSTFAYQGDGRGIAKGDIEALAAFTHAGCWPDLTLCLDVPPATSAERMHERTLDGFEREDGDFHRRVREGFAKRAAKEARIVVIDGSRALDMVSRAVRNTVEAFIRRSEATR